METTPSTTQPATPAVITGDLKLQVFKKLGKQYEVLLQQAENLKFDKNNLAAGAEEMKVIRAMETAIKDLENPFTERWKNWNESRKSILDPVANVLKTKAAEYTKLASEVTAERARQEAEKNRIKTIKDTIASFTIEFSGKIAAANDLPTLTNLQMRLGSEKSRKSFYQEFITDFFHECNGLEIALRAQKEKLTKLKELAKAEETADDEKLMEIFGQREVIEADIEQTRNDVQEKAINASTRADETIVAESTVETPKARRTSKEWRVDDVKVLLKKRPDLVDFVPNKEKIDAMLKERAKAKVFVEETVDGITFFLKPTY